jgi:hypothetical protein
MYLLGRKPRKDVFEYVYWRPSEAQSGRHFFQNILRYRYQQYGKMLQRYNTCSQHVKTSCYFDGFNRGRSYNFDL